MNKMRSPEEMEMLLQMLMNNPTMMRRFQNRFAQGSVGMVGVEKAFHQFDNLPNKPIIRVKKGDMTKETVDAIVNAANGGLVHISGLAGAIVRSGGRAIQDESEDYIEKIGRDLDAGEVAVTSGGNLPCKHVIHAVGPIWGYQSDERSKIGTQSEDIELKSCVVNSLDEITKRKLSSISLPAISSGIFGFPKERCASIIVNTCIDYLKNNPTSTIKEINLTNFDDPTVNIILDEFNRVKKQLEKENPPQESSTTTE